MRKIHVLWLALVAMFAFGTFAVSASAALTFEIALWLKNGADITTPELVDSEGELHFETEVKAHFICSGLFEGTIETNGEDLVTMVYSLEPQRLIEELAGEALLCKGGNCENSKVWPVNLPWLTEVIQDSETGKFYDLTESGGNGVPGYHQVCTVLVPIEELCEISDGIVELKNLVTDVESVGSVEPLSVCNGNAESGLLTFETGNLMSLVAGGTLAVSLP